MFMVTMHKKKLWRTAALGALAVVLVLGVSFIPEWGGEAQPVSTDAAGKLSTAEDLVTMLAANGVETDVASATVTAVTVPRKWDDDFVAFNNVVKQSGYDLKDVKNKSVDKWLLLCPAKSDNSQKTYAVVLVRDQKPVGMYFLEQPAGNVTALFTQQATAALSEEELAANATVGLSVPVEAAAPADSVQETVAEVPLETAGAPTE